MQRWVWYVFSGVFLAIAISILFAVLTHKEAGLMRVCWQQGHAIYDNPQCNTELKWNKTQLPLKYAIHFDEAHQGYINSVIEATKLWNAELGVTVFRLADNPAEAIITVEWGSMSSNVGGHVSHRGITGPKIATITLTDASDVRAVYRYAVHEFGHVLGLAHDDFAQSVMYPTQPGLTGEITFTLPSDADKKLLRELYK